MLTSSDASALQLAAVKKANQAKLELVMLVEPTVYVYIQDAKTPREKSEMIFERIDTSIGIASPTNFYKTR